MLECFGLGVVGALGMYLYIFRETRILRIIKSFQASNGFVKTPKGFRRVIPEGRLILYDFGICIILGGFVAMLITTGDSWKEAVLAGCTWNSVFAGLAKGGSK